ncbi:MAG: endonuclease/exonuclease/phosphatase family protein [Planctomycetes bacterium]|nr:endonuclease/exonuclease/phosphatase family protein [Planctomycetota bacterium]
MTHVAASNKPRRWRRRLLVALGVLAALVALVALLFVINGLWLAHGETPVVGTAGGAAVDKPASSDPAEIKVLSYNIAKGMLNDGTWRFDTAHVDERLAKIAALIRQEKPNIVFLSEAVFECQPCSRNQIEYLAAETDLKHWAFGENYNFGLPFFRIVGGNAILSRWPLTPVSNIPLPIQKPFYITKNNRRALFCQIELAGSPLLLSAIHNDSFNMKNNLVQAKLELENITGRPAILAGDFNAMPHEPAIKLLQSSGQFTAVYDGPKTFPTSKPDQTIDLIFAPAGWTVVEHHVPHCDASDHLPTVTTFRRR